ncbi:hypothetical protein [Photorhabdus laumondii]|uniref:Competence protein n=1 Tax=Photorhabdus laumondii subsp. clarkei TaxID=2029685 RepID=A0A329VK08_9GAMM|nr:hypothetical protein [Photorhabdus laumondii]RAW92074.1 hypothetical protein CKY01_06070 [Photorhabdus laumondii subsp. clarkei]
MLEYAILKKSKAIVHIDEVDYGSKCGCICPGCQDELIAKNRGKKVSHHFAHSSRDEMQSCLMTQLHIVAQKHFTEIKHIKLPEVTIYHGDYQINIPMRKAKILDAEIEFKIGRFRADAILRTNLGDIIIEIFVTHRNTSEKISYYKSNEIASLEYDLSYFKNKPIQDAIIALNSMSIPASWTCYINESYYKSKVHKEKIYHFEENKKYAKKIAKFLINENFIKFPDIKIPIDITYENKKYGFDMGLFNGDKYVRFDSLMIKEHDDFLILECVNKTGVIWFVFLFKNYIPEEIKNCNFSVIINNMFGDNCYKSNSYWFNYLPLNKLKLKRLNECAINFNNSKNIENKVVDISMKYKYFDLNKAYDLGYNQWLNWMRRNSLAPNKWSQKVKIPILLNHYKDSSCFWMFNQWHVLVLSYLVELIDECQIYREIKYDDLFERLKKILPISPVFIEIEKNVYYEYIREGNRKLIFKREIILAMLVHFHKRGYIKAYEDFFIITTCLKEQLKVEP